MSNSYVSINNMDPYELYEVEQTYHEVIYKDMEIRLNDYKEEAEKKLQYSLQFRSAGFNIENQIPRSCKVFNLLNNSHCSIERFDTLFFIENASYKTITDFGILIHPQTVELENELCQNIANSVDDELFPLLYEIIDKNKKKKQAIFLETQRSQKKKPTLGTCYWYIYALTKGIQNQAIVNFIQKIMNINGLSFLKTEELLKFIDYIMPIRNNLSHEGQMIDKQKYIELCKRFYGTESLSRWIIDFSDQGAFSKYLSLL